MGPTLSSLWHTAQGFLDYDLVRRYSRHALLGLSHLHQAGIAHLDICMSNMLVTLRDSTLKLSDLGMSADARMVSLPWKVGKSYWRSPEAVLASGWHSTRVVTPSIVSVDLWGVGAVMASLYVGSILFEIYEKNDEDKNAEIFALQARFLGAPTEPAFCPVHKQHGIVAMNIDSEEGLGNSICAEHQAVQQELRGALEHGDQPSSSANIAVCTCWPGVTSLPGWPKYGATLQHKTARPCHPIEFLQGVDHVPRPLPKGSPVAELLLELLKWDPAKRLPAAVVAAHPSMQDEDMKAAGGGGEVAQHSAQGALGGASGEVVQHSTQGAIGGAIGGGEVSQHSAQGAVGGGSGKVIPHTRLRRKTKDSSRQLQHRSCQCNGHCGDRQCRKRARKKNAPICCRLCIPGHRLCAICKCESRHCQTQRVNILRRWCHRCHTNLSLQRRPATTYVNMNGVWHFGRHWSWELKVVARHGWMLSHPDWVPCDAKAFMQAAQVFWPREGNVLDGHAIFRLWFSAWVKWPMAIRVFAQQIALGSPFPKNASDAVEQYYSAIVATAFACSGHDMSFMHKQISVQRQGAIMGLVRCLNHMGILRAHTQRNGAPSLSAGIPEDVQVLGQVRLGKGQKLYDVLANTKELESILRSVSEMTLEIPSSTPQLRHLLLLLEEWLCGFRSVWCQGSHVDDNDDDDNYFRKHVIRKFVLLFESKISSVVEDLTMAEMQRFLPDKHKLLKGLDPTMRFEELSEMFGISALMLNGLACQAHDVPTCHRHLLGTWNHRFLWLAQDIAQQNDGTYPTLKTVVEAYAETHGS